MKQYRIDEIRPRDYEQLKAHLDESYGVPKVRDLYWIPLEFDLLDDVQADHTDCHPLYFAVELQPNFLSAELLIRTRNRMRCDCIQYATKAQRNHIIRFVDRLFERLKIVT